MNYSDAIEFLYSLRLFGTKLGLENTLRMAALCGHPEKHLQFIHVAGTNGKGSTCAMLESIYRHAGYRTGLFTSPHLVSFTERIQVNRVCISEDGVVRLTEEIMTRLGGSDLDEWPFRPTFFEFVTIMALLHFQRENCGLVIWETGMGGRLDATNIVQPLVSVITNIQFDHQQWLGNALADIAEEKAGIIKRGTPVVSGAEQPEARGVIARRAAALNAPLFAVDWPYEKTLLSLPGRHQKQNAALAYETVKILQPRLPVDRAAIEEGLARTSWPGRFQLIELTNGRVLLDGAHNVEGARALAEALKERFDPAATVMVLGFLRDKAWLAMCDLLLPLCARAFLVPVQSERSIEPAEVRAYCADRFPSVPTLTASLREALKQGLGTGLLVVAGSLHLVGEAMEVLGIVPAGGAERGLNEWDAARQRSG